MNFLFVTKKYVEIEFIVEKLVVVAEAEGSASERNVKSFVRKSFRCAFRRVKCAIIKIEEWI